MGLMISSLDAAIHDGEAFACGETAFDQFLRRAARHQFQGVSRTLVLTHSAEPWHILGYYNLSLCRIACEPSDEVPAGAPPLPAMQRLRVAVHRTRQREGFGQWLLMDAIKRFALTGQRSGAHALLVHARHLKDQRFYWCLGFKVIYGRPLVLYLPLRIARHTLPLTW